MSAFNDDDDVIVIDADDSKQSEGSDVEIVGEEPSLEPANKAARHSEASTSHPHPVQPVVRKYRHKKPHSYTQEHNGARSAAVVGQSNSHRSRASSSNTNKKSSMTLTSATSRRILKEIQEIVHSSGNRLWIGDCENDISSIKAVIIGPEDTPYEGAFLYFDIQFPSSYPFDPPIFKFLSPDSSTCRMHPNLYANGKVCLDLLGTWDKDRWTPALHLEKILLTISSLLDNNPVAHEPGQTSANDPYYVLAARYLALRAAVVDIMKRTGVDPELQLRMKRYFVKNIEMYRTSVCKLHAHDGKHFRYFHGNIQLDSTALEQDIEYWYATYRRDIPADEDNDEVHEDAMNTSPLKGRSGGGDDMWISPDRK